MAYYKHYRGFEVHLEEETHRADGVYWTVRGYGSQRATGSAKSRQEAFFAACACIDEIEADPYRFPINLLGYPGNSEGEVVTKDGEILGRWVMSDDDALELVDFIPEDTDKALLQLHRIGMLCAGIRDWHEGTGHS